LGRDDFHGRLTVLYRPSIELIGTGRYDNAELITGQIDCRVGSSNTGKFTDTGGDGSSGAVPLENPLGQEYDPENILASRSANEARICPFLPRDAML